MTKLSLHHLTMIEAHPLELIEAAAAGGFDHCGIRLVAPRPGDPLIDIAGDRQAVRQVRQRLTDSGVTLLDIEAIWIGPATDVAALRLPLEVGTSLGARYALVVGNDDDAARLADNFGKLCDLAASFDMRLMLEFITYCSIGSLEAARALVETSGRPNTGILIDTLQFFRAGTRPAALDDLSPRLFPYMQICDAPLAAPTTLEARRHEARTDRRLPGEGELPVNQLLAHLPRDIVLSLEAPCAALHGLPYGERGRQAAAALRAFLDPELT